MGMKGLSGTWDWVPARLLWEAPPTACGQHSQQALTTTHQAMPHWLFLWSNPSQPLVPTMALTGATDCS